MKEAFPSIQVEENLDLTGGRVVAFPTEPLDIDRIREEVAVVIR